MSIRLRAAALALALLLPVAAIAGPPGFAFLETPAGARASAMGGAYESVAEGVEAAFWNPAGLAMVKGTQLSATHDEYIQDLRHDHFALAGELFGGGLAASVRSLYSQAIDERDDLGNLTGTFGSHDLEFQLGYGWAAGGGTSFGLTAQSVRERIANEAADTWSVGAGGLWQPQRWKDLRLSVSAHHVGPAAHYDIDGEQGAPVPLPVALATGASWHHAFGGAQLTSALETRMTRGRQAVVALGGELALPVGAALRLGLRQGDDIANFSAGIGYKTGGFTVDYAWVPSKLDLGDTNRFTIGATF